MAKDEPGGLDTNQPPWHRHRPLHPRPPCILQLWRIYKILTSPQCGQLERGGLTQKYFVKLRQIFFVKLSQTYFVKLGYKCFVQLRQKNIFVFERLSLAQLLSVAIAAAEKGGERVVAIRWADIL